MQNRSIVKYIIRRLISSVFVLLLVTIIIFCTVRLCPGDPVQARIGPYGDYSEENIARVREELGLNKPVYTQYLIWLKNCLKGNLGVSLRNGAPLTEIIMDKLAVSIELIVAAVLIALLIAIPTGIVSGIRSGSAFDKVSTAFSTSFLAMPSFCVGLLMIALFSVHLGWLPSNGYVSPNEDLMSNLQLLLMPALTLGIFVSASVFKFVRSDTREVVNSNYIRTAVAKGIPQMRINFIHILRNISVTIVTVTGTEFATLLGGTIIIEQLFGWSGMGWYLCSAVSNRDYPAVQGTVLVIAVLFVLINMIMDILYTLIDPRIDLE